MSVPKRFRKATQIFAKNDKQMTLIKGSVIALLNKNLIFNYTTKWRVVNKHKVNYDIKR